MSSTGSRPPAHVTLTTLPDVACCTPEVIMNTEAGACFSADRKHRCTLWRRWSDGPLLMGCLLNPSIADAYQLDRTLGRFNTYAQDWDFGGMLIVNAFGLVSTKSAGLLATSFVDAVGPENDAHIAAMLSMMGVGRLMVGWGAKLDHPRLQPRLAQLRALIACDAFCWDVTDSGQPVHPLYQRRSKPARPFVWAAQRRGCVVSGA